MSNSEQLVTPILPHNPLRLEAAIATTGRRMFSMKGEFEHSYLTDIQLLLGGFAFVLIIIFAVAAILDRRSGKAARLRGSRLELDSKFMAYDPGLEKRGNARHSRATHAESTEPELDPPGGQRTFDGELQGIEGD